MPKVRKKKPIEATKRDEVAAIVAAIHGVTPRYVRFVREGKRTNHAIMESLIEYKQRKNLLIEEVKRIVSF